MLAWIDAELKRLEEEGLRRCLTTRGGGSEEVGSRQRAEGSEQRAEDRNTSLPADLCLSPTSLRNFGSNDYLGLCGDRRLIAAAAVAMEQEGFGSGASPLITGRSTSHERLELALARFEGTEAALLFPSGFAANCGAVAGLVGPGDVVFSDAKNHASLWDGCRLSRADVRTYPHGDATALEKLLAGAAKYRRRLVVTDSLFSMDGDLAPLAELTDITRRHDSMLLIDEAHATGVFGREGRGAAEHLGVEGEHLIRVGTLSKALGCSGGFVVGSRALIDWLVNKSRPYIYSTAAPPSIAAAALAALQIVVSEPHRRSELLARAADLRCKLIEQGWSIGPSRSQIIPIVVGTTERAVALAAKLRAHGFFVPAIRPPTVPEGEACLRISLSWLHGRAEIEGLVTALAAEKGKKNTDKR